MGCEFFNTAKKRYETLLNAFRGFFERNNLILASFFVSLFAAIICFAASSLWPFGGRSLMSMDAWGQYYQMLRELKSALYDGNLFYSWNGGLGFDMLSQISYYTGSPFWLILILIPERFFTAAVHVIEIFKFAFAGMTFAVLLEKKFKRSGIMQVAFAVSYSFSAYNIAFINQFMWFDAVILLPLVVLGIDRMCSDKKPILYFVSLALTIISNFYIGFMVCVFSLLYFIAQELTSKRSISQHISSTVRFGIWSLLSGGAAAIFLLPVYFSIQNTAAASLGFEGNLELYHSFAEFIENMTPFSKISLEFGVANVYCGVLPLILFICYLFCGKIPLFKRVVFGVLTTFMLLSFELNLLDFIWHGFHYPNQLPGRQSFIYVLLILILAYEAFINFEKIGKVFALVAAFIPIFVFYIALYLESGNPSTADFANRTLTAGIICGFVYAVMIFIVKINRSEKSLSIIAGVLSVIVIAETVSSAAFMMNGQTRATAYDSLTVFDDSMEAVTEKYESGEDNFYRTEWMPPYLFNPGMMYDYNGISYYSSMMSAGAYAFFQNAGYPIYAKNVSTRYVTSPVLDALLGVKYVYERTSQTYPYYTKIEQLSNIAVLENENCLPVVFMADEAIKTFAEQYKSGRYSAYDYQNGLFIATGATDRSLYTKIEPDNEVLQNAVLREQQGKIYYKRLKDELPVSSVTEYKITESGEYYLCTNIKAGTVTVFVNGEEVKSFDPSANTLPYIGSFAESDEVTVRFSSEGYGYALYGIELYHFDRNEFSSGISLLKENGGIVEYASRSKLVIGIDAGEGGMLFTSIPNNGGWTLTCDGKNVPLGSVADFLICADLPAGEHTLVFTYVSPGFIPGLVISTASVLIALLLSVLVYSKKRKS